MERRAPLGMLMFLLNEAVLFFMLIAAYVYFHGSTVGTAARSLNLASAAIFTICLLASSFTMWRAAGRGRLWLGVTLGLGAIFLFGQGAEYWHLFHQNITMAGNQFGTTFFTLTGIHALHVFIGLILVAILLRGAASRAMLDSIALYWYFVDAVWLVIFAVVYLWTFL